ncbi:MAG: CapA family protein [Myxococcales bacterium]|jgi:hypothetical protein
MLTHLALSLALAAAPAQEAAPVDHYARGVEALRARDAAAAAQALSACTAEQPERVECHWELGWAHWLAGDWAKVVAAWEQVEKLDPTHAELAEKLAEARAQLALRERLAAAKEAPVEAVHRPAPEGAALRLRAVGDVMIGTDFPAGYLPPEDGAVVLRAVRELLADADLTFANLEGPLCDRGETTKCRKGGNCYAFRSPTRYGRYLKEAGVDLVGVANNHVGDFGAVCRADTEATLDELGIKWSGPPGTVASLERNGLKVAMIAFHASTATNDLNDIETAKALVREASSAHDLVIVSFHGGAEGPKALHVPHGPETFYGENRGDLRRFTHEVVDAGADLVVGHGPHVVRAIEIYKDRLIAYSLGNFATYGRFNLRGPNGLGFILDVTLDAEGRFLAGKAIATRQIDKGIAVPDPDGAVLGLLRKLSAEDFPDTGVTVAEDGRLDRRTPTMVATPASAEKQAKPASVKPQEAP